MNKGTYIYPGSVEEVFTSASNILFDAVSHTLGKDGLNTAIPTQNSYLSIINDGKTILESISSDDPAIKLALNTLKESSFATNLNAGDGTTSTVVIQHKLLTSIIQNNFDGTDIITSKDLQLVRDKLLSCLPKYRKEIKSDEDLVKVVKVALGGDHLSDVVSQAFLYNGLSNKQKPSIIKSKNPETKVINIDGVSLSPVEVNPVVLRSVPVSSDEELNVLIINQNISRIDKAFTKLLQTIAASQKKTILLYTEIMPSVMDQILYNIQEGSLPLIPIRLAYPIDKIKDYIKELSLYFNSKVIDDLNPYQVAYGDKEIFGKASGYVINKDSAVIKNINEEYKSDLLPSKSSVIEVGFITFSQQEEDYRRIEDAVHSAYNSLIYGYTIGAGYTLMCLSTELSEFSENIQKVIGKVLNYLHSFLRGEEDSIKFSDYCIDNVFDSYKVTEQTILNAFTVVSQVLSTRRILVPYK